MNAGIRTISGIRFLIDEITTFEQINTNMVANPIPIPLMAEEVVPNVGHIPKRSTNVGFSLTIPFINTLKLFIVCSFLIFVLQSCFGHSAFLQSALSQLAGSHLPPQAALQAAESQACPQQS